MTEQQELTAGITRRRALRDIGTATVGAGVLGSGLGELVARASAAAPKHGTLNDIEHVIILMQENRSFDHYFGTLSGVRGFGDKKGRAAFTQKGTDGKTLHPFHLPTDCLPDITHDWVPQHQSWAGGHMSGFLSAHETVDPAGVGPQTMGYYARKDIPFYSALADAFTICDGYHCSVIGPTDPNRLMSMSASIDPAGTHGGPLCQTLVGARASYAGRFTWPTMPERLQAHGVDFKIYQDMAGGGVLDNVLPYFKAYTDTSTELYHRALGTSYPGDFISDLKHNSLPKVSWMLTGLVDSEHPDFSGAVPGELVVRQIVEALLAHPKVWAKTALFITWDENGGFFDHVAPPTPPKGTKGEFLTASASAIAAAGAGTVRGPIGLGFRVPMLVVSPFSRGGLVSSDVFDHTSTLRFIETRFGVEVPNLTSWRRKTCGDLTSAFNFAAGRKTARPRLPAVRTPSPCASPRTPVTPPSNAPFPKQAKGKRGRPSGIVHIVK